MKHYHLFDNYYYLPDYKCFVSTSSLIECIKLPSEFTSSFTDIQHSASNNERSLLATSAYLILSDICNLQCSYCYSSASTEGRLMSLEIAKSVVRFVVRNAIIKKFAGVCRVCIRQYQKSTQKQALQGRNESTNQKVRTLFLYIPLKLQSAHWFFLKIFCKMKVPKDKVQ